MEFKIILDKNRKEEVIVYAHEINDTIREIENLICNKKFEINGYTSKEIARLHIDEIFCFTIEKGKLYAITPKGNYHIKERLYKIEELVTSNFIKINQSTLANIKHIKKFEASVGGTLMVVFKNGHKDYISRRQLKIVKERLGLKWIIDM